MGKKAMSLPSSIVNTVVSLRPEDATHYRLIDAQNRQFPPRDQPAYLAHIRVDLPAVPPGRYGLQFETLDGTVVTSDSQEVPSIEIGSNSEVVSTSVDVEVHNELRWQDAEKRQHRLTREAMNNDALQSAFAMLAEQHQQMLGLTKQFLEGQRHLFEQQNKLLEQTRAMQPPPPGADWPGVVKTVITAIQDVVKSGIGAATAERLAARSTGREALFPDSKPQALPAATSSDNEPPSRSMASRENSVSAESGAAPVAVAQPVEAEAGSSSPSDTSRCVSKESPKSAPSRPSEPKREETEEEISSPLARSREVWREMKRRVVQVSDDSIAWILSSPENFADFFVYLASPARESGLVESPP